MTIFILFIPKSLYPATNNFSSRSPNQVTIEAPLPTLAVGEKLVYEVSWFGVPVGIGQLEVKEKTTMGGREAFHVTALARTNDFLSKLYPVVDEIHSWIDAENFHSLAFRKTLSEGRYRADETVAYDAAAKKGVYESLHNKSKKEFPIEGPVHDLLSAFYWFRLQNAKPGEVVKTVVNDDEKNWDLELRVLKYEEKELRGGQVIPAIQVEPRTRLKGILYNRGRAWVYFSADARRVPIWITIQTSFGPVVGVLKK